MLWKRKKKRSDKFELYEEGVSVMSEKNIKQLFQVIADILSDREGIKVTVKSVKKKEKEVA